MDLTATRVKKSEQFGKLFQGQFALVYADLDTLLTLSEILDTWCGQLASDLELD